MQDGRFRRFKAQGQLPVHQPHTAVNDRFFHGLQAVLPAYNELAEGKQKVRFQRKRAFIPGHVHLDVHGVDMALAVRGNVYDLPAQPAHKGRIFSHGVNDDDPVLCHKEYID